MFILVNAIFLWMIFNGCKALTTTFLYEDASCKMYFDKHFYSPIKLIENCINYKQKICLFYGSLNAVLQHKYLVMYLCSNSSVKKSRELNANEYAFSEITKSKIVFVMDIISGIIYFSYLTDFSYFSLTKKSERCRTWSEHVKLIFWKEVWMVSAILHWFLVILFSNQ